MNRWAVMKTNLNDLNTFIAVVQNGNFTKAASALGSTQSAVSQSIHNLEQNLELKLFNRTTRSVTLTEAGENLFEYVGHHLEDINLGLERLSLMKNKPHGRVRITADDFSIKYYIYKKIKNIVKEYPDIKIELVSDNRQVDIAQEGYDAGVRLGLSIEKDMIAVPISHPIKMCLVASPEYMKGRQKIESVQDLNKHRCIGIKLLTTNSLLAWDFMQNGKAMSYKIESNLVFTGVERVLDAVIDGLGVAYLPLDILNDYLAEGKLISFLDESTTSYPPLYLFYTSRRFNSPAFQIICNALREI